MKVLGIPVLLGFPSVMQCEEGQGADSETFHKHSMF